MSTSDEGYDYAPGQRSPRNRIIDYIRNIAIIGFIYIIMKWLGANFGEYLNFVNYPLLIGVSILTVNLWLIVFEKFGLFIESYSIDLTNLPVVGELKPSSNEIKSQFLTHDGYPLKWIYKNKTITKTVLEMIAGLEVSEVFNKLDEIVIENAMYANYLGLITHGISKELVDIRDPTSLKNVIQAMEKQINEKQLLVTENSDINLIPRPSHLEK